jgi:hypothetical protein
MPLHRSNRKKGIFIRWNFGNRSSTMFNTTKIYLQRYWT